MAKGARFRSRLDWERAAWLAGTIVAPHVRRVPSINRMLSFLGRDDEEDGTRPDIATQDEASSFVFEIARKHKKKAWTLLGAEFEEKDKE